jgi:hypothetical protein
VHLESLCTQIVSTELSSNNCKALLDISLFKGGIASNKAWVSWYLWHLVDQKGFFDKYDVDVELVWFPVYADSLSALILGKLMGRESTKTNLNGF